MDKLLRDSIESAEVDDRFKAETSIADKALQEADIKTLHTLLNKRTKELGTLIAGYGLMADAGKVQPRQSDESIMAMRDVALAAIALAEKVAEKLQ